jgi:hypothetical protein
MFVASSSDRRSSSARSAQPPVFLNDASRHKPLLFQRAQDPTEVARIDAKAAPQLTDVGALRTDLPEQPRLTVRTVALQEPIVQSANALGHDSVEASHLLNSARVHFSDYSQRNGAVKFHLYGGTSRGVWSRDGCT